MSSDESDIDFSLSQFMRGLKKKKKAPARTKRPNFSASVPDIVEVSEPKKRKAPGKPKKSETAQVPVESQIPSNGDAPPEVEKSARKKRKAPAKLKKSETAQVPLESQIPSNDDAPPEVEMSARKKRKAPAKPKKSETAQVPLESQIPSNDDAPPEVEMSARKKRRSSESSHLHALPGIEASKPARPRRSKAVSPTSESPITHAPPETEVSKRKKKVPTQPKSSEGAQSQPLPSVRPRIAEASESPSSPPMSEGPNADAPLRVEISEFDFSVENHFKAVDTIAKLCGQPDILDSDNEEIQRFSNSVTFLREWRDFKYAPRVVKFACQKSSEESDVIGEITLPQFSSAAFPKRRMQSGSKVTGTESNEDFVMNVGGSVWALDWCPRDDRISGNHIKSEFVAVAAHPPESSYHKMGAPLTGRGAIQIWCLLTVHEETSMEVVLRGRGRPKKPTGPANKLGEPPKPRGRPRKPVGNPKKNKPDGPLRPPRGRPRKTPLCNPVEEMDTSPLDVEPISVRPGLLAVEFTNGNVGGHLSEDSERTLGDIVKHHAEDTERKHEGSVGHLGEGNERTNEDNVGHHVEDNERKHEDSVEHQTEENEIAHEDIDDNHVEDDERTHEASDGNITEDGERTHENAKTSGNLIPRDVALPRMVLCLAHNGKVAWDVKWRPVHASHPGSPGNMGYLAVLLGSGALEVWEVPLLHTVKFIYPAFQERIDPRFIKLHPVFKCSMLKFGGRRSIPLTMEWSLSRPHDMILAGCHDGTVALWKFSITDPSTETRPLLLFNADTGPIRSLAWTPPQSDLGSENIIVTAGFKGFKIWDIRDPFKPMWSHYIRGVSYCVEWLQDPRCVLGCTDDGTLWIINLLLKATSSEIPVAGRSRSKLGILHTFYCSSFTIWSAQASQLTGMVAYCGEDGKTFCFKPTTRLLHDPRKENKVEHHLSGSVLEEDAAIVVSTPFPDSSLHKTIPGMKCGPKLKHQEEMPEEHMANVDDELGDDMTKEELPSIKGKSSAQQSKGEVKPTFDVLPPKSVAMHRVRWNVNKSSERWLCYGGAAGLVRCQKVILSSFY